MSCRKQSKTRIFFFQAEDGIRDFHVTGVQTCALPISRRAPCGRRCPGPPPPARRPSPPRCRRARPRRPRSEERRVGKEGRARWAAKHLKKKIFASSYSVAVPLLDTSTHNAAERLAVST